MKKKRIDGSQFDLGACAGPERVADVVEPMRRFRANGAAGEQLSESVREKCESTCFLADDRFDSATSRGEELSFLLEQALNSRRSERTFRQPTEETVLHEVVDVERGERLAPHDHADESLEASVERERGVAAIHGVLP